MFYEAEGAYSSFLRYFCVQRRPLHVIVAKPDERPSKYQPNVCRIFTAFGGYFIRFIDDNMKWSALNTKIPQKWRVRTLSFIKHQKLLKNSTWAWSYLNFFDKIVEFAWNPCWPKIWQWHVRAKHSFCRKSGITMQLLNIIFLPHFHSRRPCLLADNP